MLFQNEEKLIRKHRQENETDEPLSAEVDNSPSIETAEKKILDVVGAEENIVRMNGAR